MRSSWPPTAKNRESGDQASCGLASEQKGLGGIARVGMSERVGSMSGGFVEMGDGWSGGKTYTVESTEVPSIGIRQSVCQFSFS